MFKIFTSTLLILAMPLTVFAVMQSPNYKIDYETITPGGGIEKSTNYKNLETLDEIGEGKSESSNYQVGGGLNYGIQADQPGTPTLLNTGSYNSLNFRINRGYELSDTDPSLVAHYKFNTDPVVDSYTTTGVASEIISAGGNTKISQKFQAGSFTNISAIDIYQTAAGTLVGDIRIETDSAGSPSGSLVYVDAYANNITLNAGSATHIPLNAISVITAGMEYWIVFSTDSGSGTFQGNTAGTADQAKYYDGANWNYSANVESLYFKVQNQVDDSSDTGNNGKVVGPITADGRFGRALDFDGTNDYVDCGNDASLVLNSQTVEFWFKPPTDTGGAWWEYRFINKGSLENPSILDGRDGHTIMYIIRDQGGAFHGLASVKTTWDASAWYHYAGTYDAVTGVWKVYINGVLDNDKTDLFVPRITTDDHLFIGSFDGAVDNRFNGLIDEVGIYNRAKTAYEISRDAQIDNPEDAEYAIAISDDNWATTNYIQASNALGNAMAWQTYANWGSGNGETLTGLKQETEYKMKAKARHGDFTETGWSSETSAITSPLDLSFSIDKRWIDLGTLVPNQVSSGSHLLTVITNGEYGYVTTIQEDGNLRQGDGLAEIADVTDGQVSRGEEYGVRTSGSAEGQMSDQDYAITSSPQTIASSTGPVNPSVVAVTFKAVVDPLIPAGKYSHRVTYICTTTF